MVNLYEKNISLVCNIKINIYKKFQVSGILVWNFTIKYSTIIKEL